MFFKKDVANRYRPILFVTASNERHCAKSTVFGVFLVRIQFECWKIQIKKIKEDHTCFLKLRESFLNIPKIKKSLDLKNIHNLRKSKNVQNTKLK